MAMLKELLDKGKVEKRNTENYVNEMNRFMKHWYPSDDWDEEAESIIKEKIEEIEDKKLTVSEASKQIEETYRTGDISIVVRSLWYTILSESDIEFGLKFD